MNDKTKRRLYWIDIEDNIYYLLIVNSLINLDANKKLKKRLLKNQNPNNEIRNEYLFSSYILLYIYLVFLVRNQENLDNLEVDDENYELENLRVLGSYMFILAQMIVIYYFYNSSNFDDSPI